MMDSVALFEPGSYDIPVTINAHPVRNREMILLGDFYSLWYMLQVFLFYQSDHLHWAKTKSNALAHPDPRNYIRNEVESPHNS